MDRSQFEQTVDAVLESLPEWVVEKIDNLHIIIEEEPPTELGEVLGVYEGINLPERSGDYWGALPDRIVVFAGPHRRMGLDEEELRLEVRKTVLHELGHHLGIDDDRMAELGWD